MVKNKKKAPHTKKQLAESPDLLYNNTQCRRQDVPNDPETCNVTLDAKEWAVNLINTISDGGFKPDDDIMLPGEIIKALGDNVVDGYMWSPTALIEGVTLIALSQGVAGLGEFVNTVDHLHQIGKKVYIYCVHKTHSAEWPMGVRYAVI